MLAPSLVKEIVKKEKPNFVRLNKTGLGEVSSINIKRVQMLKNQKETRRAHSVNQGSTARQSEQMTRQSTMEASLMIASSPPHISTKKAFAFNGSSRTGRSHRGVKSSSHAKKRAFGYT